MTAVRSHNVCTPPSDSTWTWSVRYGLYAHDMLHVVSTGFAHDHAVATWGYMLDTVRGAVRRL